MPIPTPTQGLSVPLTYNTDDFAIDAIFADGGGQVFAQIRNGALVMLFPGGGLAFPILAPNGTALAPSYSFGAKPTAGMWYDAGLDAIVLQGLGGVGALTIDNTGVTLLQAPDVTIASLTTALVLTSGIGVPVQILPQGVPTVEFWPGGPIFINGSFGLPGQVPTSAGIGFPVVWATPAPPTVLPTVAALSLVAGTGAPGYAAATNLANGAAGELVIAGSPGVAGQVPTSAGPGAAIVYATPATSGGAILTWGAENISSAADTRVMPPGYSDGLINTNTPRGFVAPRAGIMRKLFARHNTAVGNGNVVAYTLRVNGVATALTVSLATAAIGSASNLVNTIAIAQGDLVEMLAIKAVAIGSGALDLLVSVEFV